MSTECQIRLSITSGSMSLADISKRLGVEHASELSVGMGRRDPVRQTRSKLTKWVAPLSHKTAPPQAAVDEAIATTERLRSARESLMRLREDGCDIVLGCVVFLRGPNTTIGCSHEAVGPLRDLGADLEVSIYVTA